MHPSKLYGVLFSAAPLTAWPYTMDLTTWPTKLVKYTPPPFPVFYISQFSGTYCGQMRNLVVFSTHNQLYVTFHTLKRTAQVFNRGFFGIYEFSEDYVKLGEREMNNSGFRRIVEEEFYFQILSRTRMRSTFGELSVTRKSWARKNPADTCLVPIIHSHTRYITGHCIENVWHWMCIFSALHRVSILHLRDAGQPEPGESCPLIWQVRHSWRQTNQQVSLNQWCSFCPFIFISPL